MVLGDKHSAHNKLFDPLRQNDPHMAKQTCLTLEPPSNKRRKTYQPEDGAIGSTVKSPDQSSRVTRQVIPDSDGESDDAPLETQGLPSTQPTDLEQTLPPITTDKQAIEEYETWRASQTASNSSDLRGNFSQREWIPGKSSIYVDAFHLALDTVLKDEKHLFDDAELTLFQQWQSSSYEAQYL